MPETVHTIKAGSLVQCRDTDKIGCVIKTYATDNDFMCQVSWSNGEIDDTRAIDLELLDKS